MVGHHPTKKLIGREPIPHQNPPKREPIPAPPCGSTSTPRISTPFRALSRSRGQVTHVILTRSPLTHPQGAGPFDLHVLSTPPAFVLSQDQTLQKNQSPRQHHEPKGTHKPPRNQHHPDKQNKPSTPQTHPQKACPEHTQQKTRQTKHTKTKHTIEISNNTPSTPTTGGTNSSGVAVRRSKNLAGEFAAVKPGTCDPSLLRHLISHRRVPRSPQASRLVATDEYLTSIHRRGQPEAT